MVHQHYIFCKRHIGQVCSFLTHDGRVISGRIVRVTQSDVYLEQIGRTVSHEDKKITSAITAESSGKKEDGSEVIFFFPFFLLPLAAIAAAGVGAAAFARRRRFGFGRRGFGRGFI